MLKLRLKTSMTCPRHPRYDPEKEGGGGIKGACLGCWALSDAYLEFLKFKEKLAKSQSQIPQAPA